MKCHAFLTTGGSARPSLVDALIAIAQEAYDAHPELVPAGTFNPQFSSGVLLCVSASHKDQRLLHVRGTDDVLKLCKPSVMF